MNFKTFLEPFCRQYVIYTDGTLKKNNTMPSKTMNAKTTNRKFKKAKVVETSLAQIENTKTGRIRYMDNGKFISETKFWELWEKEFTTALRIPHFQTTKTEKGNLKHEIYF